MLRKKQNFTGGMIKADPIQDNVVVATDPIVKNRNILNELDKLHPSHVIITQEIRN